MRYFLAIIAMAWCCSCNPPKVTNVEGQSAAAQYKWTMSTTWPPNFPLLGEGCSLFAQWVEEMSNGQMKIEVYGAGELIPALETFDAVRSGTIELGHGSPYYWAGKVPAAQFFASVPFGMNAQQLNAWVGSGGGMELWQELYAPFNLVPFLAGNTNAQMGGWFNKEINSLEDFKGLKMRMPGLGGRVLEGVEAAPVLLAGGEIYTSLERGVIDATEWIGPYHDYLMGFHKIAKYYYYPGWHESGTSLELIVNKEAFEALPKNLQVIIETAAFRLNQWMMAEGEDKNSAYLKILIEQEGVDVRPFPDDVLKALKLESQKVIEKLVQSDADCKKVYESFQAFKQQNKPWADKTERRFYNYE